MSIFPDVMNSNTAAMNSSHSVYSELHTSKAYRGISSV